jgi:hypothetical protein
MSSLYNSICLKIFIDISFSLLLLLVCLYWGYFNNLPMGLLVITFSLLSFTLITFYQSKSFCDLNCLLLIVNIFIMAGRHNFSLSKLHFPSDLQSSCLWALSFKHLRWCDISKSTQFQSFYFPFCTCPDSRFPAYSPSFPFFLPLSLPLSPFLPSTKYVY